MVLDRFRRVDGLVRTSWTTSLNGPGVEFEQSNMYCGSEYDRYL